MACRRLSTNCVYATLQSGYNYRVETLTLPLSCFSAGDPMHGLPEPPPVSPLLKVLIYRDYLRTAHRWVALCVVNNGKENSLRFYKWRRDEQGSAWKVDLARFSVADVDLGHTQRTQSNLPAPTGLSSIGPPSGKGTLPPIRRSHANLFWSYRSRRDYRHTLVRSGIGSSYFSSYSHLVSIISNPRVFDYLGTLDSSWVASRQDARPGRNLTEDTR